LGFNLGIGGGLEKLSITGDSLQLLIVRVVRKNTGLSSGSGFFLFLPHERMGDSGRTWVFFPNFLQDSTGEFDSSISQRFKGEKRETFTSKQDVVIALKIFIVFFNTPPPSSGGY
jgi:hypothetical protein